MESKISFMQLTKLLLDKWADYYCKSDNVLSFGSVKKSDQISSAKSEYYVHTRDPRIEAVVYKWLLFRCACAFYYKYGRWDLKIG
jgi:hypothetical protein